MVAAKSILHYRNNPPPNNTYHCDTCMLQLSCEEEGRSTTTIEARLLPHSFYHEFPVPVTSQSMLTFTQLLLLTDSFVLVETKGVKKTCHSYEAMH